MANRESRRLAPVLMLGLAGIAACAPPAVPSQAPPMDVVGQLAGNAGGFALVDRVRPFVFPADHGPHPRFRNEWWYVTANVADSDGEAFGVQFTLFRNALRPRTRPSVSAWATPQLYMAHLAVSDHRRSRFQAFERFARGAVGLAGARAQPFAAWLEDWRLEQVPGEGSPTEPVLRLRARQDSLAVDLQLRADKPLLLQGDRGLSRKGAAPGSASYYYSLSRMRAQGTVQVDEHPVAVTGQAWMDREWSSNALEPGQVGWDWFALQLNDGRELMLYRMRRRDGSIDPASAGVLVEPEGTGRTLPSNAFEVEVSRRWRSPHSGVQYPASWQLSVPSAVLTLHVEPLLADQELNLAFRYWEGSVRVQGTRRGRPLSGVGFVELTGYGSR